MGRRSPRRLAVGVEAVIRSAEPRTPLARVQSVWREALGVRIAEEAEAVSEREGVITVACRSATWASELDLMQEELRGRLNGRLGEGTVRGLRVTAGADSDEPGTGS
jgi:predicted nucleic acid-binding Zn ribbon protein